jgi:SpoVK/Ycf46/Vps4 family AAA+-type ATPase
VPLLRLDFASLYSKWHGESEKNLRDSLRAAEALAPCVLWVDEIEKARRRGSEGDGGVSRRVLVTFLTWLAEQRARIFVVATANDIEALPPELIRKGRFDEIFFVDLPALETRSDILAIHAHNEVSSSPLKSSRRLRRTAKASRARSSSRRSSPRSTRRIRRSSPCARR